MVTSYPDLVGANTVQGLDTTNLPTATSGWIQVIITGAGTVRMGGSEVSSSRGLPIPAGGGMFLPWRIAALHSQYQLAQLKFYIPAGATVSVGISTD